MAAPQYLVKAIKDWQRDTLIYRRMLIPARSVCQSTPRRWLTHESVRSESRNESRLQPFFSGQRVPLKLDSIRWFSGT
jgi:hypothetical protein